MNLVFDMDGTIADLYSVKGWLNYLEAEDAKPYKEAKPMLDMKELKELLLKAKAKGYKVVVTSWLCGKIGKELRTPSKQYDKEVREAKINWLKENDFPYDEIHLVKYGTTKANCTRKDGQGQILFDDKEKIRKGWKLGEAYPETEIINILKELVK